MSTNEKPRKPAAEKPRAATAKAAPKTRTAKPAAAPKLPAPPVEAEGGPERIAKYLARAGVCSRRDAERLIAEGKVTIDGVPLDTPAFKVTGAERIMVEGKLVGTPPRSRLWRFFKPRGLVVSHKDDQGRMTIFDFLHSHGLPRVISVGRLDLNSEGLILLTNDGALARQLELPSNGWVRHYKVRVAGEIDVARMEALKKGITIDGVRYGAIEVEIDRIGGLNAWLYVSLKEGKNREIRRVMEHLGLSVNRLVRVAYGPFDIDKLEPGDVMPIGQPVVDKILKGEEITYEKPEPKPVKPARAPRPEQGEGGERKPPRGRGAPSEKSVSAKPGSGKSGIGKSAPLGREDRPVPKRGGGKPLTIKSTTTGKGPRDAHRRRP